MRQQNARHRVQSNRLASQEVRADEELKVHENTEVRAWRGMMLSKPLTALRKRIKRPTNPTFSWLAAAFSLSLVGSWLLPLLWNEPDHVSPRYVRHLMNESHHPFEDLTRLNVNMEIYPSKREVYVSKGAKFSQGMLENSKEYYSGMADVFETEDCKAQYPWQLTSFPTCNNLHESDLTDLHATSREDERVRLIAHGYWRDVWMVRDNNGKGTKQVLKTMRYQHDFEERNYDRHRRDAVAMERLTKSPLVVDIFGFCGNSGLFEYASGGDISDILWPSKHTVAELTSLHKLQIATQVAMAIAVVHNIDKEGQASIAHTDITPGQFVLIGDVFKLNDFNRARFIRWNEKKNKPCTYKVGRNPGKNRSPEEYKYEPQTEKVDIYSMGNIIYMLLTGLWPFDEFEDEEAQNQVIDGARPSFTLSVWNSSDPTIQFLKQAMFRCHEQHPEDRGTAREVEAMLKGELLKQDPDALHRWGLLV